MSNNKYNIITDCKRLRAAILYGNCSPFCCLKLIFVAEITMLGFIINLEDVYNKR